MKRVPYLIFGLCVGLFLLPQTTQAGPIIRSGEVVSVDTSQSLKGDFYALGSTVTLSGPSEYDAYLVGNTITVNAPVAEDLVIIGGSAQVHSTTSDDVRVLGGDVTLGGTVEGDVLVIGGTLTILSTAHIEGDVLFFGNSLILEGDVDGSVHGHAQTVRINSTVGGDVTMTVSKALTLNDHAHVMGDISYTSMHELLRAQGATIDGEVHRFDIISSDTKGTFKSFLFLILAMTFLAASFLVLGSQKIERVMDDVFSRPGQNGLMGLLMFLVIPIIGLLLCVSVVGIPLGVFVIALSVASAPLALGLSILFCGYAIERLFFKRSVLRSSTLALGVPMFVIISVIPIVGPFMVLALCLMMIGAVGRYVFRFVRA